MPVDHTGRDRAGRPGARGRPRHHAFAVTAPGLEPLAAAELEALGLRSARAGRGGVRFTATTRQLYAANLWLRTATRVLVRAGRFDAATFADLEAGAAEIEWARWIEGGRPVHLRVTSIGSRLHHTGAIEERIRRAAGLGPAPDAPSAPDPASAEPGGPPAPHRAARGRRVAARDEPHEPATVDALAGGGPPAPEEAQLVVVRIAHDQVTISIDSSGEPLSRRGWRRATAKAPLRESLAAALLLAAGWDPSTPLIDPFCGSGTIAIEAALLAAGAAPGRGRAFAFASWPEFEPGTWASVRAEAIGAERGIGDDATGPGPAAGGPAGGPAGEPVRIRASDRDAGAVAATLANAERAGVAGWLAVERASVSELTAPAAGPGLVLANPPYGRRVSRGADLRDLYAALGRALRREAAGWRVGLLVDDARPVTAAGLRLDERLRTHNGGTPVRLLVGAVPS